MPPRNGARAQGLPSPCWCLLAAAVLGPPAFFPTSINSRAGSRSQISQRRILTPQLCVPTVVTIRGPGPAFQPEIVCFRAAEGLCGPSMSEPASVFHLSHNASTSAGSIQGQLWRGEKHQIGPAGYSKARAQLATDRASELAESTATDRALSGLRSKTQSAKNRTMNNAVQNASCESRLSNSSKQT